MALVFVGSREYKIMLKASRFAGDEAQVLKTASQFWREGTEVFSRAVLFTSGNLDQVESHRLIRFYDTSTQHLNRNAYIFRERIELDPESREVTLKFRHPDRYIASDRQMNAEKGAKAKTKFEEDIKPPFQHLYSFSTTQLIPPDRKVGRMKDVLKLYPGLKGSLKGFNDEESLAAVDNFTARELVIGGGSMQLGKTHKVASSCVLVIWYDNDDPKNDAVVAEFSFKYGDNGESYGGGTVRRAYEMFHLLQSQLGEWTDKDSKTKTAFVYS
jgi:hypothetical protein